MPFLRVAGGSMVFPGSHALCKVDRQLVCWFLAGLLMSTMASRLALAGDKPAWIELRSPNFIVVTNAGERQARRTISVRNDSSGVSRVFRSETRVKRTTGDDSRCEG